MYLSGLWLLIVYTETIMNLFQHAKYRMGLPLKHPQFQGFSDKMLVIYVNGFLHQVGCLITRVVLFELPWDISLGGYNAPLMQDYTYVCYRDAAYMANLNLIFICLHWPSETIFSLNASRILEVEEWRPAVIMSEHLYSSQWWTTRTYCC